MKPRDFLKAKKAGKKWCLLTAYDAPTAELLADAGVDAILVGDSLGMVVLGYASTAEVTIDEMLHHAKSVRRGAPGSLIIGDLPLKGIEKGPRQALASAKRFMKEAGCDAVKLEWGQEALTTLDLLKKHRIPVMGHVGLTPQTIKKFKIRGANAPDAFEIWRQAESFQNRGAFSVLLECVPSSLAKFITKNLKIPTVGIGAGPTCDGQVLVFQDLVGIFKKFLPKHVKRYMDLDTPMRKAVKRFAREVKSGVFPSKKQEFGMPKTEFEKFISQTRGSDPRNKRGLTP